MTLEHPPHSTARRTLLFAGLIVLAGALFLILVGSRVWARGQINLFGLDLERAWTEYPLNPSQSACSQGADAETVQRLQTHLQRSERYDSYSALHKGAEACLRGDLQQAVEAWSAGVGEYPPDPMMSIFTAVTAFADGRMIETPYVDGIGRYGHKQCVQSDRAGETLVAISWCEFSFAYTPNATVAGKLASLYEKLGDKSSAQEVWHRLQETVASSSPDYWWALGQAMEQEKDWLAAANAYQRGAVLVEEKDAFRYYLRVGLMELRVQDYAKAESAYQQALALNPDKEDAYLGIGDVHRSQKQYKDAVRWYEKAREVEPKRPSTLYKLGLVARAQGDYEEALTHFERSLVLRPDNPGVLYYKAVTLDTLGRRVEAIVVLEQAITAHQNPPENWTTLLVHWRGE